MLEFTSITKDCLVFRKRKGAAAVESAIVLPVLLLVIFALLDLGLACTRYNALAATSRRIARDVIMHGSLVSDYQASWGPDEYNGKISDNSPMVAGGMNFTPTMSPDDVNVRITWLDGDNSPHDRINVEISFQHEPLVPSLFVWGPLDLQSNTIMSIVN